MPKIFLLFQLCLILSMLSKASGHINYTKTNEKMISRIISRPIINKRLAQIFLHPSQDLNGFSADQLSAPGQKLDTAIV